jgi:hypothetical protein
MRGLAGYGLLTADQRRARAHLLAWIVALPGSVEPAIAAGAEIARLAQAVESGDWRLEAIDLLKQLQSERPQAPPARRRPRLMLVN